MRKNIIWYRLQSKRLEAGLTQTDLAKAVGRTPQWVSKLESGKTNTIDKDDLDRIAKVLHIHSEELLTDFDFTDVNDLKNQYIALPHISDSGQISNEHTPFPETLIRKYFGRPNNLALFHQQSGSMSPTIDHGDDVIIDLSETTIKDDLAIYLFQNFAGDIVFLKRIHIRPQGGYVIKSDAGDIFTDMIITKEEAKEMKVIGKALGRFSIKTF
ncbi:LexA family transcriptional regulator [Cardiobacteriaceae bacterium TAE3-ERU3]|nr:LexA family transcriptional regulator [Cardiobacteriaceae bacterium TAE3-ERU3]